jgi:hypothetical protein
MVETLVALVVDESKWLTASLAVAFVATTTLLVRHGRRRAPRSGLVLAAMSLFFGVTISTMAAGHLLAVSVKLALGTLEGPIAIVYAIGVVLAAPSWWLVAHTPRVLANEPKDRTTTMMLNAGTTGALLILGLHNLPLAAPGIVNVAYQLQSRRLTAWALVGLSIVINLGLLGGSLVFLASGQSFEQFSGME